MISTTPQRHRQQDHRVDQRLAHRAGQLDIATDVRVELVECLVHAAGELGGPEERHEVAREDVGMQVERLGDRSPGRDPVEDVGQHLFESFVGGVLAKVVERLDHRDTGPQEGRHLPREVHDLDQRHLRLGDLDVQALALDDLEHAHALHGQLVPRHVGRGRLDLALDGLALERLGLVAILLGRRERRRTRPGLLGQCHWSPSPARSGAGSVGLGRAFFKCAGGPEDPLELGSRSSVAGRSPG